jgi:phosphate-selective porin OprO/OprP
VPFAGYFVSAGYFLTGEHVERRTRLKPLYPLLPVSKNDERGMGAWEAAGRVSRLRLGSEVFDGGLADPNLWSSSATTTELGLNWYWNEYIKWYMFWLHADFGSPVQFRPGERQKTADMLWLRAQLYF